VSFLADPLVPVDSFTRLFLDPRLGDASFRFDVHNREYDLAYLLGGLILGISLGLTDGLGQGGSRGD